MHFLTHLRRLAALAAGTTAVGALAAFAGASPALAQPTAYGSGAAVQSKIQDLWIKDFAGTPPSIQYDSTNSADGFNEFGNETGTLDPGEDPDAPSGELDGYVAVDDPALPEQQSKAVGAAKLTATNATELTIPVGQVSEALELSLPEGVTLNSAQNIDLTNLLASELYAGKVPANDGYPADSWGALLTSDPGPDLTPETLENPPMATGDFYEGGTAPSGDETYGTGGYSQITDEVRTDGAGATLVLKQYLDYADTSIWHGATDSVAINEDTENTSPPSSPYQWPVNAVVDGYNASDSSEATATAGHPGEVGYGTLGAAIGDSDGAFGATPTTITAGGSHQILYAFVQDNGTEPTGAVYADPANGDASNVYTGTSINTSGTYDPGNQTGAGNWIVPQSRGSLNAYGTWSSDNNDATASDYTHGWDVDVYNDILDNSTAYYPLDIVIWDLTWSDQAWGTGELISPLYPDPPGWSAIQTAVAEYLQDVTSSTGQSDEQGGEYFAELPTGGTGVANIQADASAIAADIDKNNT